MKTIIHNYGKIPEGLRYEYGTPTELDEYDLRDVAKLDLDEVWYWYAQGHYDGSGAILMRKGDEYDLGNLGHCSCDGPTASLGFQGTTFEELKKSLSTGLDEETKCLFEMAEKTLLQ